MMPSLQSAGAFATMLAALLLLSASSSLAALSRATGEWVDVGRADSRATVSFTVALHQNKDGLARLDEAFWAVSTPSNRMYGKHWSVEDVADAVAPPAAHVDAVMKWCMEHTAVSLQPDSSSCVLGATRDYVFVTATAAVAETMVGVPIRELHFHRTIISNGLRSRGPVFRRAFRAAADAHFVLDAAVRPFVARIDSLAGPPIVPATTPRGSTESSSPIKDAGANVTPDVIRSQYEGPSTTAAASAGGGIAVAEFEQAYFYPSDVTIFSTKYDLKDVPVTIIGKNDPNTGYLGECTLDVEYVSGYGSPKHMVSMGEFGLVKWAQTVLSTPNVGKVQSVSWGSGENAGGDFASINTEFIKMGLVGFTVLAASGDQGTGATGFLSCGEFNPTFPATSPYVTAVGGTYTSSDTGNAPETGWMYSGGGFSTVFPRPSYQHQAVSKYLTRSDLPAQKYWNSSGRAVPDVAALSTNFQVVINNYTGPLSGTSAATPTFASLVAVANAERVAAGKSPLGFLNPALYSAGTAGIGTDITSGNNKDPWCPAGFPAVPGWDAITGLGTPMWPTLQATLTAL